MATTAMDIDRGNNNPLNKTYGDVLKGFDYQGAVNKLGYTARDVFGNTYTPSGGGTTTWGEVSNPTASTGSTSTSGNFWREQLSKNPALSAALETIIGSIGGSTQANMSAVDQFTKAMQAIAKQNESLTAGQMGAANAPFTTLAGDLGTARSTWANKAGSAADKVTADMTGAANEWNTGQTGRITSLKDSLSSQLDQSLDAMRGQIGSAYTQEQAANAQYGTLRNRLSTLAQNNAMNQILARTAPGLGSAGSGLNSRIALRMGSDAGAQDALLMAQMNKEALGRKLAGEAGLLETQANLGRADIQNISGLGMGQADNYYKQLAAIQGQDAARRQYIIDQIQGQGAINDIGYVGQQQLNWYGKPQQQLTANAANYLAPIQANQAALAGQLGLINQGGQALNAANWLSVGTNQNLGGTPRYSAPPALGNPESPVPTGYDYGSMGYAPTGTATGGNPNNFTLTERPAQAVTQPRSWPPQYAQPYSVDEIGSASAYGMSPGEYRNWQSQQRNIPQQGYAPTYDPFSYNIPLSGYFDQWYNSPGYTSGMYE
jgi:hypothetical protein